MRIKKRRLGAVALGFILFAAGVLLWVGRTPTEPTYNGIGLSSWLEGTAGGNGPVGTPVSQDLLASLRTNREEVVPWLLAYLKSGSRTFQRRYAKFHSEANPRTFPGMAGQRVPTGPGNRWSFIGPWLPTPVYYRTGSFYGLPLLAELAPGTRCEGQVLDYLIAQQFQTGDGHGEMRINVLKWLGNFTNFPDRVIPQLIAGLRNAGSVGVCIDSLDRFGTNALPQLYRVAQLETGYMRPAEVALEKLDPAAYEKLRAEKEKSGTP